MSSIPQNDQRGRNLRGCLWLPVMLILIAFGGQAHGGAIICWKLVEKKCCGCENKDPCQGAFTLCNPFNPKCGNYYGCKTVPCCELAEKGESGKENCKSLGLVYCADVFECGCESPWWVPGPIPVFFCVLKDLTKDDERYADARVPDGPGCVGE